MEFLPLPAGEIDPEDVLGTDALGPDLAVDLVVQAHEVQLHPDVVPLRVERIVFDLAGLRIEIPERALIHGIEPEGSPRVEVDREIAFRRVGLELLYGVFGELEGLGIELGDELIAEIGVPDYAVSGDHVMRLDHL